MHRWLLVKGIPPIIHLFIGFSIIFTIHFGGNGPPIFGSTSRWVDTKSLFIKLQTVHTVWNCSFPHYLWMMSATLHHQVEHRIFFKPHGNHGPIFSISVFNSSWWQLKYLWNFHHFSLGKWSNLTCSYFSNGLVKNHQLALCYMAVLLIFTANRSASKAPICRFFLEQWRWISHHHQVRKRGWNEKGDQHFFMSCWRLTLPMANL